MLGNIHHAQTVAAQKLFMQKGRLGLRPNPADNWQLHPHIGTPRKILYGKR